MTILALVVGAAPSHASAAASSSETCAREAGSTETCGGQPYQGIELNATTINPHLVRAEYAVRGKVLLRAHELERRLQQPDRGGLPFDRIVYCNIGNPQALGQRPLTFARRVQALVLAPDLINRTDLGYPSDVTARANVYLDMVKGAPGAYTDSQGIRGVRDEVAEFLFERDSVRADANEIFLTSGASQGVEFIMKALIRSPNDSILVPIPQYPLYSALSALLNGHFQGYALDEDLNWDLSMDALTAALRRARDAGKTPRAVVCINPGNPTGATLSREKMRELALFAAENKLVLLADEVYQANVYTGKPFVSFRKVVLGLPKEQRPQLVSFHSVSKGVTGECGMRGGYFEMIGFSYEVRQQLYKLASIGLCPNVPGQITVGLMVRPPKEGEPSYELDQAERRTIFESLQRRALKLVHALNELPGVHAAPAQGAMYAFPRLELPARYVELARNVGDGASPDEFYALQLLEKTGVVVVPGAGFGQRDGTYHFRATILPPEDVLDSVVAAVGVFHRRLMKTYGG